MSTTAHRLSSPAAALHAAGFVGRVVEPGDADYDAARAVFNGAVDARPAAVACATDAEDVAAAVRGARAAGMPFTIRAGGHSITGRSVRDGALCIDLRAMRAIRVDPERALVRVGAGALLGELDVATQEHGLAVPAGQISHTGVAGLTLGGGMGWLMRRHGLTVDSLLAADVVLADGTTARASADEHPDLFWALRGGGGDFAVVTAFEFRGHRVGPTLLAGILLYPWERAGEALRATRALMADAPDDLMAFATLVTAPPHPPFPAELHGRRAVAVTVVWTGDPADGERAVAPLRAAAPPVADLVAPMPFVALQSMLDGTAPPGFQYYDRLHYLREVGDAFLERLLAGFERAPSPFAHVNMGWMGGAVRRVDPAATAFGHRDAEALVWFIGAAGPAPVGPVRDWVRGVWRDTAAFATGQTYVNALDAEGPARDAYATATWERLVAIKRRYDPDRVLSGSGIG